MSADPDDSAGRTQGTGARCDSSPNPRLRFATPPTDATSPATNPAAAGPRAGYAAAALSAATLLLYGLTLLDLIRRNPGPKTSIGVALTVVLGVVPVVFAVVLAIHYVRRARGHRPPQRRVRVHRCTLVAAWALIVLTVLLTNVDDPPRAAWLALLTALGWTATALIADRQGRAPI